MAGKSRQGSGEMSADMTMRQRTDAIASDLERFQVYHGLGVLNGGVREGKRVEKLIASAQESVAAALALAMPDTLRHLNPAAMILTLVAALEQMTLARGNHLYQVDGLHSCAMEFMPDDIRGHWRTIGPHKLAGYISHEPEVAEQLEARGILVWRGEDRLVRLVNTEWIKTDAAKREHVQRKVVGRCCSFCLIQESQTSRELIPVDPAKRGKLEILDGVAQLQTKTIHAHEKCIPHWLRWLAIAERYKTQGEAEAADIEAGRTPGALPALADLETTQEQA